MNELMSKWIYESMNSQMYGWVMKDWKDRWISEYIEERMNEYTYE